MTKSEELCQFLAFVQDNYSEVVDDGFESLDDGAIYSRLEVVDKYLDIEANYLTDRIES